jgi:monoamine oxidase
MYAAYLLHKQGVEVEILEASNRHGGRIKSLKDFTDFTIDLGAEKIKGERSPWFDMVRAAGVNFVDQELGNLYYFNGTLKNETEALENTFYLELRALVESLQHYGGADVTAEQWGINGGLSENVSNLFNAFIGNEYGTGNARIGMNGLSETKQKWTAGEKEFLLKDTDLLSIIEQQFGEILGKIKYNTPVVSVVYHGNNVQISDATSMQYKADRVIVTVPITVLKRNDILFVPALSITKTDAMQKIGMDYGMKIILRFDQRLWADNTRSIYGNGLVPEFIASGAGGRGTDNILTAFVNGPNAEALAQLGDQLIPEVLAELDGILGEATPHYVDHYIQDWGAEPYISGTCSYPLPGIDNARSLVAQSINDKVYFAGEATHTGGHFATVHGAMETGLRAVAEILGQ